jgi:hypothetical protein
MKLRTLAAVAAAGVALLMPAGASAADTDYSDLWWNPAESGWGLGLQRQADVIFLTLFVYAPDGSSTWFVGPAVAQSGAERWQGTLYRASGPAFSAPFDRNVEATPAGTVTLEFAGPANGTLTYTVDGVAVTKSISRMTWREPSAAGTYHGGFTAEVAACSDPTRVGDYEFLGNMSVTHADGQVRAAIASGTTGGPSNCTFTGATTQAGRLGSWKGTFNCTLFIGLDGRGEEVARVLRTGTFTLEEVAITASGFHGVLAAADQDCAFRGRFGGTRKP